MTGHEIDQLALFAATWRMHDHDPSMRACLKLDLEAFLSAHLPGFDRTRYWNTVSGIEHHEAAHTAYRLLDEGKILQEEPVEDPTETARGAPSL